MERLNKILNETRMGNPALDALYKSLVAQDILADEALATVKMFLQDGAKNMDNNKERKKEWLEAAAAIEKAQNVCDKMGL